MFNSDKSLFKKMALWQFFVVALTSVITYAITYYFYYDFFKHIPASILIKISFGIFILMIPVLLVFTLILFKWLYTREAKRSADHNKFKGDLVQNISHEVRTPLTSITGHVQLLEEISDNLNETQKSCLSRIGNGAKKLSSIFDDILELSMLENEAPLFIEELNSRDFVSHIVSSLQAVYSDKNHHVELDLGDFEFDGDAKLLEMSFKNIIENAFKYTPKGGSIFVSLKSDGERVKFLVRDSGPGMSKADGERVFERFFRSEQFRNSEVKGSGLGLAICKHAVGRHQGRVWVVSVENHGSSFFIELPAKQNS